MKTLSFVAQPKNLLFALLTGGVALAATFFDPDWISSTTNATQPVGYVGAPSASGYLLNSSQSIYTIDYSSTDWSGDLHSRTIDSIGTISLSDVWGNGAAYQIDQQDYNTGRMIVTYNATGVPFRWANLSAAQKTALDSATASAASTSPVLDYIRGQRSNELPNGLKYRARSNVLGDIIHSTPLHWNDGTTRTVFVGANDGMLHAINADTQVTNGGGSERFAFIPSQLISKLPLLKATPYTHRYFVDGQLAARRYPAYTESGGAAQAARSILVAGLGGGGKGLFALDIGAVPIAESDAASKVLWEISSSTSGFANLGHIYGTPILTKLPNGDAALIVGNGYNNSGNGHSTLIIINPHTGEKIDEIDAGTGSMASPNGLSSPTVVDVNLDGRSDYVYAGDIDGNFWKFDLTASPRTAVKLFPTSTALQTTPAQAITMAPGFKVHPLGGRMVTFVTGKIFDNTDASNTATHYAYGIWDRPAAYSANDTLLTQTLTEVNYTGVSPAIRVRTATSNVPDWTAGAGHHMGWKTALPLSGERVVGDGAFVTGSVFLFLATNPTINPTATPPGENWWMQINALTGGDNGAVRFDLNADTHFTTADQVSGVSPVGRYMGGGVRSQLTAFTTAGFDIYQANYDNNGDPPSTSISTATQGVAGGHFDEDIYYGTCVGRACQSKQHFHQYDDKFDVTGVNMLNPSSATLDIKGGVPSLTQNFKVIVSNQYLNPAVKMHIGDPSYLYNVDAGYISLKNYLTTGIPSLATLQTYRRDPVTVWPGAAATDAAKLAQPKYIGSLAINMPVDALTPKDWWGNGDVRVGLHPTVTDCVKKAAGDYDGNMYQPVVPPANGVDGPGVNGYSSSTTPATATGVRHNGALTIQIISDLTPDSALELAVSGRPEYGVRVKSSLYGTYVLAEYTTFWHHPNKKCYGDVGWTKNPGADNGSSTLQAKEAGSTDPKIGSLGTATPGTTTTTVSNADGTTTTTTVVVVLNIDGTYTTTTTITNSGGGSTTTVSTGNSIEIGGAVDSSGAIGGGVTTPLEPLGRVNWRELRR